MEGGLFFRASTSALASHTHNSREEKKEMMGKQKKQIGNSGRDGMGLGP